MMQTEIITITDVKAQQADLARAGKVLRSGGLVAFPTETVYGLGANGLDADACARIYEAKGRPSDNPLILHVSDRAMVEMIAAEVTPMAEKLLAAFMPGPITLILRRKAIVPDRITGGLDTVGIRMPEHPVARAMIRAAGVPVAAPSANISGRPSPTTAASVLRDMKGRIPLILDGGPCHFGVESTIVDCTGPVAVILRPGAITREMLTEVLGGCKLDPALVGADTVPRAPGMKYKHYAPKAPLTLLEGEPSKMAAAFHRHEHVVFATFDDGIFAVAQESEVIVCRPTQECLRFFDGFRVYDARLLTQARCCRQNAILHARPIFNACTHVNQHFEQ